jgi:hypothetical protein
VKGMVVHIKENRDTSLPMYSQTVVSSKIAVIILNNKSLSHGDIKIPVSFNKPCQTLFLLTVRTANMNLNFG